MLRSVHPADLLGSGDALIGNILIKCDVRTCVRAIVLKVRLERTYLLSMNTTRITVRKNGDWFSVDVVHISGEWSAHFGTRAEADAYAAKVKG